MIKKKRVLFYLIVVLPMIGIIIYTAYNAGWKLTNLQLKGALVLLSLALGLKIWSFVSPKVVNVIHWFRHHLTPRKTAH